MISLSHRKHWLLAVTLTTSMGMAGSLYAKKLPEQEFDLVRAAITEAQEVRSEAAAGNELLFAEQKLERARHLNEDGDEEEAARLLTEAKLHAEFAEVKGLHAIAMASLGEIDDALADLERELGR